MRMSKAKRTHSLVEVVERSLAPGAFIPYSQSWDFVRQLEQVKSQLDRMAKADEVRQVVGVYEVFLAGCYDKAAEIDDSGGNLSMFFQELLISWVKARQRAGADPTKTVRCILQWMDHDEYGFCYGIEGDVAKALNKTGLDIFKSSFESRLETALASCDTGERQQIHKHPYSVRQPAAALRAIYLARSDVRSYVKLCEKFIPSPRDCEHIAMLHKAKRRFAEALTWVERGLQAESDAAWGSEFSHALSTLQRDLLAGLGRREDALDAAWANFSEAPSAYGYADVMKYVPRGEHRSWREKATQTAEKADLRGYIDVCVETKQWQRLADRVLSVGHEELESLSHYLTERAASGLARKHAAAAAKIYRALALRILKVGKSKYYSIALAHLEKAKRLHTKLEDYAEWQAIVDEIRRDHARKHGFIPSFDQLVSGDKPECPGSFEKRARRRWREQTSKPAER